MAQGQEKFMPESLLHHVYFVKNPLQITLLITSIVIYMVDAGTMKWNLYLQVSTLGWRQGIVLV
jgi:hypothetical protein